jgi:hypothetical protein
MLTASNQYQNIQISSFSFTLTTSMGAMKNLSNAMRFLAVSHSPIKKGNEFIQKTFPNPFIQFPPNAHF